MRLIAIAVLLALAALANAAPRVPRPPQAPPVMSGHYETVRTCNGGVCTTSQVWVADVAQRGCPAGMCQSCQCVDESKCGTPQGACLKPTPLPLPVTYSAPTVYAVPTVYSSPFSSGGCSTGNCQPAYRSGRYFFRR